MRLTDPTSPLFEEDGNSHLLRKPDDTICPSGMHGTGGKARVLFRFTADNNPIHAN